jgi:hypothetical protein
LRLSAKSASQLASSIFLSQKTSQQYFQQARSAQANRLLVPKTQIYMIFRKRQKLGRIFIRREKKETMTK